MSAENIDFLSLPKVLLHDHLDGGLRTQTIVELAKQVNHELPTQNASELAKWFKKQATHGSLEKYLETFSHTVALMQSKKNLIRIASECVQDLAHDNVVYAEIRYAPEQHVLSGLTLPEVVEAVWEGFTQGMAIAAAVGLKIQVKQILCGLRHKNQVFEIAKLAVSSKHLGVVGFDLAGPEAGFPATLFKETFTYLQENFFPTTLHAGEACGISSISSAINTGRALRLGHGVNIVEDLETTQTISAESAKLGAVATWVRDRGIPLEICPSSNLQTGATGNALVNHPFDLLYKLGFVVTVNTDNRLMSKTSLTQEFQLLQKCFAYKISDFEIFTLNAMRYAFVSLPEKEALIDYIIEGFDWVISGKLEDKTDLV